ncbi:MAG: pilus assembly protein PilX [Oscillospiraceae bacterium]|nr:pilus assembly protein PilX [Oscillospiraceae bacterium]
MRKFNAILSMSILALFLIHAIAGSFQLAGWMAGGSGIMQAVAWIMLILILIHVGIGCKLTVDTLRIQKKAGVSYPKENKLFWLRRISGFAIMIFILFHVLLFLGKNQDGVYRLSYFGTLQLLSQILLVISIAVHVLTNIRPLMIAVGTKSYAKIMIDILFILSVILILSGIGFVIYYLRWNF